MQKHNSLIVILTISFLILNACASALLVPEENTSSHEIGSDLSERSDKPIPPTNNVQAIIDDDGSVTYYSINTESGSGYIDKKYNKKRAKEIRENAVEIEKEQFHEGLGQRMKQNAIAISCSSDPRPKEVVLTYSIAISAGIGLIENTGASIVETTWDTAELCNSAK